MVKDVFDVHLTRFSHISKRLRIICFTEIGWHNVGISGYSVPSRKVPTLGNINLALSEISSLVMDIFIIIHGLFYGIMAPYEGCPLPRVTTYIWSSLYKLLCWAYGT